MKIIRRFSSGLFVPQDISKYQNDKSIFTLFIFLLLVLLYALPNFLLLGQTGKMTYDDEVEIRNIFYNDVNEIPFSIKNNQLINDNLDNNYIYKKQITNNLLLVFSVNGDYQNGVFDTKTVIIVSEHGVFLSRSLFSKLLFTYVEYPVLNGIDFSLAQIDDAMFWDRVFPTIEKVLEEFKPSMIFTEILLAILSSVISIAFWSLLITIFQKTGVAQNMKFLKLWQMMIYAMIPFVLGMLLSNLFSSILLYYGGFLLTIINANRAGQAMTMRGREE